MKKGHVLIATRLSKDGPKKFKIDSSVYVPDLYDENTKIAKYFHGCHTHGWAKSPTINLVLCTTLLKYAIITINGLG